MSLSAKRPLPGWARFGLYVIFFGAAFHRFWNATIIFRDSLFFFAPYKFMIADALRRHTLDLWNPWMLLGMPLAGEFQAALWYPFNLLFAALPFSAAHRIYILLHYPIAAFTFDLLLRRLGLSRRAAVWGALVFSCSGYLISQHAPVRMVIGAAWAPLALYCFHRALDEKFFSAAAGAVLAVMVLAGDPETTVTTALVGSVMVLGRARLERRLVAGIPAIAVAAVFTLACGAVQLIPMLEMLRLTERVLGVREDTARFFSFMPAQLLEFVWPSPYGGVWPEVSFWGHFLVDRSSDRNLPWSLTNYLGLPALALALWGAAAGPRRLRRAALAVVAAFLAVSLAQTFPFYGWLHHLPVFSAIRYPSKFIVWVTGGTAVLSAAGLDAAVERLDRPGAWRMAAAYAAATAVIGGLMAGLWPGVIRHESGFMNIAGLANLATMEFFESLWPWLGINAAVATGWMLLSFRKLPLRPALAALLLLAVADWQLFIFSSMPAGPSGFYNFTPPTAAAISRDGGPSAGRYRIYQVPYLFNDGEPRLPLPQVARQAIWLRTDLLPNLGALDRLESMTSYDSYDFITDDKLLDLFARRWLMEMFNVRYVIDQKDDSVTNGTTVFKEKIEGLRVTRLDRAWPRAYFVARPLPARDTAEARALLAEAWRTRNAVIEGAAPVAGGTAGGLIPAEVTVHEPDRVTVKVNAPSAGWLVLSDRFYPGWEAEVDGREGEIHRANAVGRAVRVESGAHTVVFTYRPHSVRAGALVTGTAWVLLAAWGALRLVSARQ